MDTADFDLSGSEDKEQVGDGKEHGDGEAGPQAMLAEVQEKNAALETKAVVKDEGGKEVSNGEEKQACEMEGKEEESAPGGDAGKPLSKNARKTLLKMERFKEKKMQRKAFEKERRHRETARKREEWQAKQASLTEEEKEKALQEKLAVRSERKSEDKQRKERLKQAMQKGQNLVLDLEFCELMKSNEVNSLIQQIMYSYSANSKSAFPACLSLTGCRGDIRTQLDRVSGFSNWLLHKQENSYIQVFEQRKEDLVYLTADSEDVIDTLDERHIYIIGALVDRNRWKGTTLEKAKQQGIKTARLPIAEHMKMTSSHVLTVNQVVEILLSYLELRDWKKALLKAIPPRKRGPDDENTSVEKSRKTS